MSYAQIGDEALLQADYRKGEDPLAEFEAVTRPRQYRRNSDGAKFMESHLD